MGLYNWICERLPWAPKRCKPFEIKLEHFEENYTIKELPRRGIYNEIIRTLSSTRVDKCFDVELKDYVSKHVEDLLEYLRSDIGQKSEIFNGKIINAGSAYDGSKIVFPDEFDFNWNLNVDLNKLKWKHLPKPIPRNMKAAISEEYERSLFELETLCGHDGREVQFKDKLMDTFVQFLKKSLEQKFQQSEFKIEINGPAVSLYFVLYGKGIQFNKPIKIDIVLSIDLTPMRENGELSSISDLCNCDSNCIQPTELGASVRKMAFVHMVSKTWRLSFVEEEREIIRRLSNDKKTVFLALKCLRDLTAPSNQHESSPLPSYYLKIIFIKITQEITDTKDWTFPHYCDRALDVLNRLSDDAKKDNLTGIFIKKDRLGYSQQTQAHYCMEVNRMKKSLFDLCELHVTRNFYNIGLLFIVFYLLVAVELEIFFNKHWEVLCNSSFLRNGSIPGVFITLTISLRVLDQAVWFKRRFYPIICTILTNSEHHNGLSINNYEFIYSCLSNISSFLCHFILYYAIFCLIKMSSMTIALSVVIVSWLFHVIVNYRWCKKDIVCILLLLFFNFLIIWGTMEFINTIKYTTGNLRRRKDDMCVTGDWLRVYSLEIMTNVQFSLVLYVWLIKERDPSIEKPGYIYGIGIPSIVSTILYTLGGYKLVEKILSKILYRVASKHDFLRYLIFKALCNVSSDQRNVKFKLR